MTTRPGPLPSDPILCGIVELLPPDGLKAPVADALAALAALPIEPGGVAVRYVRYRPGKSCVVLWEAGGVLVSGKLFAGGRGARIAERPTFRQLVRTVERPGRPAFRYLADRGLLLQRFPLDVRLPGLPFACSPARVGAAVARRLDEAAPVSYKPWRRCVLRYRSETGALLGKLFRDERGKPMPGRLEVVGNALAGTGWRVLQPLTYLARPRLLLFEEVEGAEECSALLRAGGRDLAARRRLCESVQKAAEGLEAFRRTDPRAALPAVTATTTLAWLRRSLGDLRRADPPTAGAVEAALNRLAREADLLPPEPLALSHGAFRHDQLLVSGEELVVLDLDGLRLGAPGADPGNFLAYLDATAVRRPRLADLVEDLEEAFLGGLDEGVHPGWLAWHRAAARVKYALRSVFSLAPRWPEHVSALLNGSRPAAPAGGRR